MTEQIVIYCKLDLESIGSSLGFEGELILAVLDWRSPDISSGLVNRPRNKIFTPNWEIQGENFIFFN